MNSKYRIVFIDLDGTLLDDEKILSQESIEIIKKLDKQVPVILTSGRMPQAVFPFLEKLGIKRPVISYGGGLVYDENRNILLDKSLTYEQAKRAAEFTEKENVIPAFNFYTRNGWYTNNLNHPMEQFEAKMIGYNPVEARFDKVVKPGERVAKCLFAGYEEEIDALKEKADQYFDDLFVLKTQYFLLELYNKEVSKAGGIQTVLDYYGLTSQEAVGIGDSYNDVDMLDFVGLPILMKNGPQDLKQNKNYKITPLDNNEHGAAKFLETLFSLE